MGDINPLLLVLLLLAVVVWLISAIVPWVAFGALSRALVRRALQRPPSGVVGQGRVTLPLLATVAAGPLVAGLPLCGSTVGHVAGVLGGLMMAFALLVHSVPGHPRNLKYAAYYLGGLLFGGGLAALGPGGAGTVATIVQALFSLAVAAMAVVLVVLLRPDAPLTPDDPSAARALRWHRFVTWIQGPDPLSMIAWVAMSVVPIGPAYLLARWCIKARVGRHAVVYLRSFHYEDAGRVFGEVVNPAVHRSVGLTGLVHLTQPSAVVEKGVPTLWRSKFACIADAHWQEWVDHHLERAIGVVIDASVSSGSVAWELERVRKWLPPERILVLHRADVEPPPGFRGLAYDLGTQAGIVGAREGVADWVAGALAAYDPAVAGVPVPISPVRLQMPVIPLLGVTASVPFGIAGAVAWVGLQTLEGAKVDMAALEAGRLQTEVELYLLRKRDCPEVGDLTGVGSALDPWGTPMRIRCEPEVEAQSAGPDLVFDTPDDVSSRRP